MSEKSVCGVPGRDEDAGVDVTCDRTPHGAEEQHHAAYFGPFLKRCELEWSDPEPATVLRLLAEHVAEDGDTEALLVRLKRAGYTLPELTEGTPE
ncbi:hypothetical protein ACWDZ4_20175 [Streptomyces sp. NPDC003016]